MKKSRAHHRHEAPPDPPAAKATYRAVAIVALAAAIVATAGFWGARPTAESPKLEGRWVRPDGGYVIEVRSVGKNGNMDASYFNPRPIHVAKAEASRDGALTKVFIELRDINYPGSTYDLTYDPQTDALKGIYYQAARGQYFDVVFMRAN